MIRQLLAEVKSAPLDDASRQRLEAIHHTSIEELKQGLAPELAEELERLTLPFSEDTTPSDAELRIAQAQLVGWLEGLFHGIQTALFAQQMAARAQLEQMRRALPSGPVPHVPPESNARAAAGCTSERVRPSQPHWLSLISRTDAALPDPEVRIGQSVSSPLTGRALTSICRRARRGHPTPAAIGCFGSETACCLLGRDDFRRTQIPRIGLMIIPQNTARASAEQDQHSVVHEPQ